MPTPKQRFTSVAPSKTYQEIKEKLRIFLQRPNLNRWVTFGKLTAFTGFAQIAIQAIGFLCGILVIRVLPPEEYALYILANTMLGTMTVLADGGISSGVMAEGGKVWKDKSELGGVIATGIYLRKKFAIWSLLIATPILLYLLRHHGAGWLTSTLIILALIPAFFAALSGKILEIAPKLHQDITSLQKIQVWGNLGRLGLLVLTIFVFPWAYIVLLAAGLPQIWANLQLRKRAKIYSAPNENITSEVRQNILKLVKRLMPGAVYYAFSGQITIWLISIFGSTNSIAQLGAIARFTILLSLLTSLMGVLVVPRFSRLENDKKLLWDRFLKIEGILILLGIIVIGLVHLFSNQLLWILGANYQQLNFELLLIMISGIISFWAGSTFNLYTSRGWAMLPVISIAISVLSLATGIWFFEISTLIGVLLMNIFLATVQYFIHLVYASKKIHFS